MRRTTSTTLAFGASGHDPKYRFSEASHRFRESPTPDPSPLRWRGEHLGTCQWSPSRLRWRGVGGGAFPRLTTEMLVWGGPIRPRRDSREGSPRPGQLAKRLAIPLGR